MSRKESNSKREIIEQAARWSARLAADDVTPQDWRDFEAWVEQDPAHLDTYGSLERMSGALRSLGDKPMLQALHDSAPGIASVSEDAMVVPLRTGKRRRAWALQPLHMALAASVLVALVVPLLYFMGSQEVLEATDFESAVGERRVIDLADGTALTLNAESSVTVTFSEAERHVAVWRGDVFLDVAVDPDRSFAVSVGDHRVTVTGTSFDIHYRDDPARITVYEGTVSVSLGGDGAIIDGDVELQAGQRLTLATGAVPDELSEDELVKSADWRNGLLHFADSTLAEVVRELEPYLELPIMLTSREVAELDIGGSFNVDDVDSILTALESLLPVEIIRESDRILIRQESNATTP